MVLCGMFAALVAIGAFIQIPVPYMDYFTLQFFFVLLAGLILGADKGAISVGCYVLLGLVGVPIFAAGGGIGYIFRPSFGYLVGFIVSAYVTGKVCEKLKASYKNYLLACTYTGNVGRDLFVLLPIRYAWRFCIMSAGSRCGA